uniref:Uncharacterized protein n=1 Tax=Panagrolaimus sp. JU765 TaxID=591449 RepID=A0AC34QHC7_9BILA
MFGLHISWFKTARALNFIRNCSKDSWQVVSASNYVSRVRHMDYWQQSDNALEMEFERGHFMLMVDKEPLILNSAKLFLDTKESNLEDQFKISTSPELACFDFLELRSKLREYGLEMGHLNSVLLDVLDPSDNYPDYASFALNLALF